MKPMSQMGKRVAWALAGLFVMAIVTGGIVSAAMERAKRLIGENGNFQIREAPELPLLAQIVGVQLKASTFSIGNTGPKRWRDAWAFINNAYYCEHFALDAGRSQTVVIRNCRSLSGLPFQPSSEVKRVIVNVYVEPDGHHEERTWNFNR